MCFYASPSYEIFEKYQAYSGRGWVRENRMPTKALTLQQAKKLRKNFANAADNQECGKKHTAFLNRKGYSVLRF